VRERDVEIARLACAPAEPSGLVLQFLPIALVDDGPEETDRCPQARQRDTKAVERIGVATSSGPDMTNEIRLATLRDRLYRGFACFSILPRRRYGSASPGR
jgi:hypothetical protein